MSKSKGRKLAEWLRNLDSNSQASSSTLADDSVIAAKIADDAVTNAAIADGAVHTANIVDTGITFAKLHTALVVTESDAIGSNDNDTTIATSAAIKDYVDTAGGEVTSLYYQGSQKLTTSSYGAHVEGDITQETAHLESLKTSLFMPSLGRRYLVDTSGGAFTINLPAGSEGDQFSLTDVGGSLSTNAISLNPNGTDKIFGINEIGTINTDHTSVTLMFTTQNGWVPK